jgi:hypothetical protein
MKKTTMISAIVLAGCASSGGLKPVKRTNPFPKQERLTEIEQQPAPEQVFRKSNRVRVASWRLVGPLPDTIGAVPRSGESDLDRFAAAVAADQENGVSSEAMHCLAREVGTFFLAYDALPQKSLYTFMEHRCGVTSTGTSPNWVYWKQGGLTWEQVAKDGQLLKRLRKDAETHLEQLHNPEVGAWYGTDDDSSVAMVVAGRRDVDLEPMPMAPAEDGTFVLKGELFEDDADLVAGVVNHGDFDWEDCHDAGADLPAFHVVCEASPDDLQAGFELYSRREGELIANSRLWQRVWPAGNPARRFVLYGHEAPEQPVQSRNETEPVAAQPAIGTEGDEPAVDETVAVDEPAADAADAAADDADEPDVAEPVLAQPLEPAEFDSSPEAMRSEIGTLVNELRERGNLGAVTVSQAQSENSQKLAPHFWKASLSGDSETTHEVVFGLLAGRDVDGPIINGSFYTVSILGTPEDLVHELAARPGARSVLFDPEISTLAIGPYFEPSTRVMGALVHGWSFVPEESHTRRVNRFLDYLSEHRRARGNPRPKKIVELNERARTLAERLEAGDMELHVAANQLLRAIAAERTGERVMVYYFEAHDPAQVKIPDEILETAPLEVAVTVAPYKPPNSPWHTYGVIFAYVRREAPPTKVASAPAPRTEGADDAQGQERR